MNKDENRVKEGERDPEERYYVIAIGFFGGLFSALLTYTAHFFNFIPFGPGVIFRRLPAYPTTEWMRGPSGHWLSIVVIALLSIFFAYVYYGLFRKMNTPWVGLWYGLALWVVLFLGIRPMVPGLKSVWRFGWNTNLTLLSIFIFYGLFVGYSISYQYEQILENEGEHQ